MRIHLGSTGDVVLRFEILDTPIAELWLAKMQQRHSWALDNPARFYGFNPISTEINIALNTINNCIDVINSYEKIINRYVRTVNDQDTLNYLHNIFEKYHGQLDCQSGEWWTSAPIAVKKALAELNIAVHRCESAGHKSTPRFVCTWWRMPKTDSLTPELITSYGALGTDFGGVYLNYVEIGKTALDLANDNDVYISNEMFKPFDYYSADFVCYFKNTTKDEINEQIAVVDSYFESNKDFFNAFGISSSDDYRMLPYKFKVAQLVHDMCNENTIADIKRNQYITKIEIE